MIVFFLFNFIYCDMYDVAWQAKRKRQEELEKHKQEEHHRKQQVRNVIVFLLF